jgi:hypothetical protein
MRSPCAFADIHYPNLMTAEIITAWAAVGAAVAAIVGSFVASKSRSDFRLSLAADLSMKLEDRFDAKEFKETRSSAAKALLSKQNLENAEDIFDFFETLGLLVRTKAITKELAYNSFFHWINLYWNAGKEHVAVKRKDSKTVWENFEFIYNELLKTERQKDPNSKDISPSAERLQEDLQQEITDSK